MSERGEKLVGAIGQALSDGQMEAVGWLLQLLALEDPHRAQAVVDTMRLGIALAAAPVSSVGEPGGQQSNA